MLPMPELCPNSAGEIAAELLGRVSEVVLIHDVVAIEHRSGLMTGDIQSDPLRHSVRRHFWHFLYVVNQGCVGAGVP